MANIKDITRSAVKFVQRASVAGPQYQEGVQNPRRAWSQAAASSEQNYVAGVTAAAQAGRFSAGVKAAGDAKWQNNALAKGPGRFAEGVALAQDAWVKGFQPFQTAIQNLNLPPRGPRGAQQNLARVGAVDAALRGVKTGQAK